MKPDTVFVQLPPDLPLFIRSRQKDYRATWHKFLKKQFDGGFYVNPKPKFTSDVVLNNNRLKQLVEENIQPTIDEFELGTNTMYSTGSKQVIANLYRKSA